MSSSSTPLPSMDRSISKRASIRRTISNAIGDSAISFFPAALPTRRLENRVRVPPREIQPVVPIVGARLLDAGISCQMPMWMLAPAIARVAKYSCGRPCSAKGPVVAQINPASSGVGFPSTSTRARSLVPAAAVAVDSQQAPTRSLTRSPPRALPVPAYAARRLSRPRRTLSFIRRNPRNQTEKGGRPNAGPPPYRSLSAAAGSVNCETAAP
jgi:hypothetical protein